jgi:hypothetical protein
LVRFQQLLQLRTVTLQLRLLECALMLGQHRSHLDRVPLLRQSVLLLGLLGLLLGLETPLLLCLFYIGRLT